MKVATLFLSIPLFLLSSSIIEAQESNETTAPLLLWGDEFNGTTINTDVWTARIGNNNGWGNGELQYYAEQNVAVENQQYLSITVSKETDVNGTTTFTSARIDTKNKVHVKYGTISASIQIPNVDAGLWPAFWTLGESDVQFPAMGEMDIMEAGQAAAISEGKANNRVISGAHWDTNGTYSTDAGSRDFDADLNGTFFVYTLSWTSTNITTYVNDDQVWTMDITPEGGCLDCEEFHQPHYMVLNVAVGGGFTSFGGNSSGSSGSSSSSSIGCGNSSSSSSSSSSGSSGVCGSLRTAEDITAPLPAKMLVDWVRIYDNGESSVNSSMAPSVPAVVSAPSLSPPTASIFGGGSGKGGKSGKGSGKGGGKGGKGSGKGGKGGKGDNRDSNTEFAISGANDGTGNRLTVAVTAAAACLAIAQLL